METITVVEITLALVSIATGVLGWFARQLWDAVQILRKDLTALQVQISENYVRYERLKDILKPLMDGIEEIKEILRNKADKHEKS